MDLSKILTKLCSEQINKHISKFNIQNISVQDKIESKNISEFDKKLILGLNGTSDDAVSLLISSEGASFLDFPIKTILIPSVLDYHFFTDTENEVIATDFFYSFEKGIIKPIKTSRPLTIDGLNDTYEGWGDIKGFYPNMFIGNSDISKITDSKLESKKILKKKGFNVPRGFEINAENLHLFTQLINGFLENNYISDFVVKANDGCQGRQVRMYTRNYINRAEQYTKHLLKNHKHIVIEERIYPRVWKKNGLNLDWNIRAFVTISEEPKWIDGVVRYGFMNRNPKNISLGADVEELSKVAVDSDFSIEDIIETSIKVADAIYKSVPKSQRTPGYLGIDIIVDSDERVFVYETNDIHSGGFAELSMIRNKELSSVADILLPEIGPILYDNYKKRKNKKNYKQISFEKEKQLEIAVFLEGWGRKKEANELFSRIASENPQWPEVYTWWASSLADQKRYEEAIEKLTKSVQINPENMPVYMTWGGILHNLKKYDEALAKYKKAFELESDYTYALFKMGGVEISRKNYHKAYQLLDKVLEIDQENIASYLTLSELEVRMKKIHKATEYLQKAREINPVDELVLDMLARVFLKSKNLSGASEVINLLIEVNPNNANAHCNKGILECIRKRYEDAISSYQIALSLDPKNEWVVSNLVEILTYQEKYKEADLILDDFIKKKPDCDKSIHLESYRTKSYIYLSNKEYKQAFPLVKKILKIVPNDEFAKNAMGGILFNKKDYRGAIKHFREACTINPKQELYLYNLANALVHCKDFSEADNVVSKFIDMKPNFEKAYTLRSEILYEKGDKEGALENLKKALEINPDNKTAKYNLNIVGIQLYKGNFNLFEKKIKNFVRDLK